MDNMIDAVEEADLQWAERLGRRDLYQKEDSTERLWGICRDCAHNRNIEICIGATGPGCKYWKE